jgi:putative phage-type endonuclease
MLTILSKRYGLTDAQQTIRKTGIPASAIGILFGADPYRTEYDLWLSMQPGFVPPPSGIAALLGHMLEPVVAEMYVAKFEEAGMPVELVSPGTLVHPQHKVIIATPDRLVNPAATTLEPWLLEVKTKSWRTSEGFGDDGSDVVPPHIALQAHQQMLVAGRNRCDVAVLIDGREFRCYTLRSDAEIAERIVEVATEWHAKHIVTGIAPEPQFSNNMVAWVSSRFPRETSADLVPATDDDLKLITGFVAARDARLFAESREEELATLLKHRIGERIGFGGDWGKITWKANKDGVDTDWKAIALASGATPELIAEHTKAKSGARVLRPALAKEKAATP